MAQNVQIKTITVEPYMSTENYEHFKRMVPNSSDSHARYIDGFDFIGDIGTHLKSVRLGR